MHDNPCPNCGYCPTCGRKGGYPGTRPRFGDTYGRITESTTSTATFDSLPTEVVQQDVEVGD